MLRRLTFGRSVGGITARVIGDVCCPTNHLEIAARSYVCPSAAQTGSIITSVVIGQWKLGGVAGVPASLSAHALAWAARPGELESSAERRVAAFAHMPARTRAHAPGTRLVATHTHTHTHTHPSAHARRRTDHLVQTRDGVGVLRRVRSAPHVVRADAHGLAVDLAAHTRVAL